jgi:hypothetical protein
LVRGSTKTWVPTTAGGGVSGTATGGLFAGGLDDTACAGAAPTAPTTITAATAVVNRVRVPMAQA